MSFLCTVDGELVTGYPDGHARMRTFEGVEFYDWPKPWGFRCDECGEVFEYGCTAGEHSRSKLVPPQMRQVGGDRHRCAFCDGYVEPDVQLTLDVPRADIRDGMAIR